MCLDIFAIIYTPKKEKKEKSPSHSLAKRGIRKINLTSTFFIAGTEQEQTV